MAVGRGRERECSARTYKYTSLPPRSLSLPTHSHRGFGKGVVQFGWALGLLKGGDCCRGKGLGNHLIQTPKILAKQPPQAPTIGF